ncbi:MAG TPA: TrmH family RNA methyltransferase [Candidatus Saccharimonadales bacterium]|jgi:tRNA G18 (ribose-2'-O)-methylase SpoU
MTEIILIAHDIRSAHNVGSLLRSSDGFGVTRFIASGVTPYPELPDDTRLPHIAKRLTSQIAKTSLGAETYMKIEHYETPPLDALRSAGYTIVGLEQDPTAVNLRDYKAPNKLALLLGEEVNGMPPSLRTECDVLLEIPMFGRKESFNVSVAAAVALYQLIR